MLKFLTYALIIYVAACTPRKNYIDERIVFHVNEAPKDLLVDYRQVEECTLNYWKEGFFHLSNTNEGAYLLPKDFSKKHDDGNYIYVEYAYGTLGVVFNKTLPSTIDNPNWIKMMLSGLKQPSNTKTDSYYLSRFFLFSPSHTLNRKVWVVSDSNLFILKSENGERFMMLFFFLQDEVVSIQSFGGEIKYMSDFIKDVGLHCE